MCIRDRRKKMAMLADEIGRKQGELAEMRRSLPRVQVEDYELKDVDGTVRLSEMFGDKPDLIVSFNMGKSCPYCTLWADEYNGVLHHLENRAAFVMVSPDAPDVQREFAEGRGWRFRVVSHEGTTFAKDSGFTGDMGDGGEGMMPGFATYRRSDDGTIERISSDFYGPGDVYCSVWHFFGHLAEGPGDWQPQFSYD